jgi:hypothetical protein
MTDHQTYSDPIIDEMIGCRILIDGTQIGTIVQAANTVNGWQFRLDNNVWIKDPRSTPAAEIVSHYHSGYYD